MRQIEWLTVKLLSAMMISLSLVIIGTANAQPTGGVKGTLIYKDSGKLAANEDIGLPEAIMENEQIVGMRYAGRSTTTNESGVFLFKELPPGKYLITLQSLGLSHSLLTNDKGQIILIEVKAGEQANLGKVFIVRKK